LPQVIGSMFTGIIETIGEVVSTQSNNGDIRLCVVANEFKERTIAIGDSIAINGVCLTIVAHNSANAIFEFDVSVESINHSLIGKWRVGTLVNLEMALLPTTRLGGHLVSGHVDGIAKLVELQEDARSWRMVFEAPENLKKYIARKGSITIDGVSLTVNSVEDKLFNINVIPHTFKVTTLGALKIGDQVHIEVDILARYLERLLTADQSNSEPPITMAFLDEQGFS